MTATIGNTMKRGVLEWGSKARKASENEVRANTKKYIENEMKEIYQRDNNRVSYN